jgi:hypothetical protein
MSKAVTVCKQAPAELTAPDSFPPRILLEIKHLIASIGATRLASQVHFAYAPQ